MFTKTEKAALRVFESVERYFTRKLKLVVNHAKSCVRSTDGLEFLGYQFIGYSGQMRVSPKNLLIELSSLLIAPATVATEARVVEPSEINSNNESES